LLDVARHFFTKAELKEVIDSLAIHKLNRLQLHLTDDQGWRLEITKYPRLTEVSAWRKEIGFGLDPKSSNAYGPDGRYGGFYTHEDIRELVSYANSRHVMLVPEIEMPGHASGALSAYPELSCSGGPYNTDSGGGVFDGVFCAGNSKTYEFIEAVLSEVAALFPGTYIHIGGDEVPKRNWKGCAKCQAQMRAERLKTEESLQSYFVGRAEAVVKGLGRTLIGWSEIREGGLVKDAVLMDWIGGALESARQGHKVIMSPTAYCYLDYYQATNRPGEPRAIGGYIPLDRTYRLEPIPEGLEQEYQLNVLGAQGNLWTEYIPSLEHAQYMTFPRLCALAEVTWSPKKARNYDDFSRRLESHLQRLEALKINYRPGIPGRDEPMETKVRN
jgi:hexosaminidase